MSTTKWCLHCCASDCVEKEDKCLSSQSKLKLQHMFQQEELHLSPFAFHFFQRLQPVATCPLMCFFFFPPSLFFLQTLHICCSHTSHIASASYSSNGSHGLNLGECLSSDIYGCSFQLAWFHVCRENINEICGNGGLNYCMLVLKRKNQYLGTLQLYCQMGRHVYGSLGTFSKVFFMCWHSCGGYGVTTRWMHCTLWDSEWRKHPGSPRWQKFSKSDPLRRQKTREKWKHLFCF